MAQDINRRLSQLNVRRRGFDSRLTLDGKNEVLAKAYASERYETRTTRPFTKYALGSMQEVGPAYTQVGLDDAERVGKQLKRGLLEKKIPVDFRLQGSVPLNVHIRGVSDVDLLTLHDGFVTVDQTGRKHLAGHYTYGGVDPLSEMRKLRSHSEVVLRDSYPAADIDKTGNKAIKISGGSLRRSIDVVPSHWHDTADYQQSSAEHDRGVNIYDKSAHDTLMNYPFKHIKLVDEMDVKTNSGTKKTIRLCKNVKSDAIGDGKSIALSSFDITGLMWHAEWWKMYIASFNDLALLGETQAHLDALCRDMQRARSLKVPDGSRFILDSAEKAQSLVTLSLEVDELTKQVAREQTKLSNLDTIPWDQVNKSLSEVVIP